MSGPGLAVNSDRQIVEAFPRCFREHVLQQRMEGSSVDLVSGAQQIEKDLLVRADAQTIRRSGHEDISPRKNQLFHKQSKNPRRGGPAERPPYGRAWIPARPCARDPGSSSKQPAKLPNRQVCRIGIEKKCGEPAGHRIKTFRKGSVSAPTRRDDARRRSLPTVRLWRPMTGRPGVRAECLETQSATLARARRLSAVVRRVHRSRGAGYSSIPLAERGPNSSP